MRAAAEEAALDQKYGGRGGTAVVPPPPADDLSDLAALLGGSAEEVPDEPEGDDAADLADALKLAKDTMAEAAADQVGLFRAVIVVVVVREVVRKVGGDVWVSARGVAVGGRWWGGGTAAMGR